MHFHSARWLHFLSPPPPFFSPNYHPQTHSESKNYAFIRDVLLCIMKQQCTYSVTDNLFNQTTSKMSTLKVSCSGATFMQINYIIFMLWHSSYANYHVNFSNVQSVKLPLSSYGHIECYKDVQVTQLYLYNGGHAKVTCQRSAVIYSQTYP